ncbi:hypothetical protein EDB85DRAFT_2139881 [Lactarius pseudohatsudake]|nr:hypothetical protein EDB85DRAFT_2139881 [Lactarius pseudohatsudake]
MPIPAHSSLPSKLVTRVIPPLLVHTVLLPPPPGLSLVSPSQAINFVLTSHRNFPPSSLTVPIDLRLPRPPPTLPISSASPCSPPPRPPDTMPADSERRRRQPDPPTLSYAKVVDTTARPRKEYHSNQSKTQQQGHGKPQNHCISFAPPTSQLPLASQTEKTPLPPPYEAAFTAYNCCRTVKS